MDDEEEVTTEGAEDAEVGGGEAIGKGRWAMDDEEEVTTEGAEDAEVGEGKR